MLCDNIDRFSNVYNATESALKFAGIFDQYRTIEIWKNYIVYYITICGIFIIIIITVMYL